MLATALLVLSYVVYWISYFMPKKKLYLKVSLTSAVITLAWFLVIKQYDGLANHLIGMTRDILVLKVPKRYRHVVAVFITLAATVSIAIAWSGWASLVVLAVAYTGIIINVYAEMGALRVIVIIRSLLYCVFLFLCGQYLGILLEGCDTVVCVIAQAYYTRKEKKECSQM